MSKARALLASAFLLLFSAPAFSADNFYKLSDRWEKAQASGLTKKEAVESGFASALQNPPQSVQAPVSLPIRRGLSQLSQSHIDVELNQSLLVSANGIVKFFSTSDGVVAMQAVDPNLLQIVGTRFGTTFVHVYDSLGRTTFELQCVPPTYTLTTSQIRKTEEAEKTRPFRFSYGAGRSAFYTGDKFTEKTRSNLQLDQTFGLAGDTPYGYLSSYMATQKDRNKNIISDAQVALRDGRIGPWNNFDAVAGDSSVYTPLMVFPAARIRGAQVDQRFEDANTKAKAFYGREKFGILGTLTPGLTAKRSISSYLGGVTLDHKFDARNRVRAGYFNGHGTARVDDANRHAGGVITDVALGPAVTFTPEVDFDNERFAQRHAVRYQSDRLTVRQEFRDISKKFETLVGRPSQQGEIGYLTQASLEATEDVVFSGSFDVFRDRLIPNPDNENHYNAHRELGMSWSIDDATTLRLDYQDLDDTGRLGPTKQRSVGGQLNRVVNPFDHRVVLFSRYQNRGYRNLVNSEANYVVDQVIFGATTGLFWGVSFTAEKEFDFLREPIIDEHSMPNATTYSLDWSRQLGTTPFSVSARLRHRDEEETEAQNSFMSGEDVTDFSAGLYWREDADHEVFITGRFANYVPESLFVTSPRIEAEFITGVRYDWDTGFSWSAKGAYEGFVYKDMNGDGVRDENESGIPGVGVTAGDAKGVTDEKGFFELKNVSGRKATVVIDTSKLPYGYALTTSPSREVDVRPGKPQQLDFGATPRSEISGIVFNDLDGNGKYDLSDKGVAKIALLLENGKIERTKVTGAYFFSSVLSGEHTVSLDLSSVPPGYLPAGEMKKTVTVFEGIRYEQNFPLKAVRALSGRVFLDANGNKQLDGLEKGVPNVVVQMGEVPAVTDDEGYFLFDGLPPGTHRLEPDPKTLPAGSEVTFAPTIAMNEEPLTLTDRNIAVSAPAESVSG